MYDLIVELGIRYLHFLAIFALFALLTIEHTLLKDHLDTAQLKRAAIVDLALGITGLIALSLGLGLWFLGGKPTGFYDNNWAFQLKLTLFVVLAALSFIPTQFIRQQQKSGASGVAVPKYIVLIIRLELLLICLIPLFAVMMANGVGYTY